MKNQYTEENFFGYAYELNHLTMDYPQYLSKDALLEWAEGYKKELGKEMELYPDDRVMWGELMAVKKLIEKLESL